MQGIVRVGIVRVARHGLNRAGLLVPQLRDELMCSTTVPKLRYDVRFLSSWGGQGGGRTSSRVFYASPAKTVDPAPSPSMPPPGIYQRIRSTIKTNVTYYRIRNSDPPFHFTSESFIPEAAEMYRNFMTALNRVDRSSLREILTERMFSRFKSHLPDKKEMKREKKKKQDKEEETLVFVTGECSIVQARAIQIAPPVDTVFVQITCEIQVVFRFLADACMVCLFAGCSVAQLS